MKWTYLILFLFTFMHCRASGIELASLYFEETSAEPTGYTVAKMSHMKELISSRHVQFIEINAFADNISSFEANKALAEQRLKYVLEYFGLQPEDGVVNVYGQSKLPLNFVPFNWERVDIYYYFGDEENLQVEHAEIGTGSNDKEVEYSGDLQVPELDEIVEDQPLLLNIGFISGKFDVKKGSMPKLDQLYNTMVKYPDLNVLIRGHVCCENKKGASKKRAKVVYDYLKGKGISKKRLSFKGYGNEEPLIFPERTPDDRAKNRRVDLVFSKNSGSK